MSKRLTSKRKYRQYCAQFSSTLEDSPYVFDLDLFQSVLITDLAFRSDGKEKRMPFQLR
jgi:hypothetical protein